MTKLTADSGVSDAGLRTTVLPQTSAGMIFHDGIAIGKFHGVIRPQTPSGWRTDIANLSRSSDGTVCPDRRRPSPGHEERHVDRFLHVAARFVEDLAHLARHVARERLLALGEQLRGAEEQLRTPRRRHEAPGAIRARGGLDGAFDVVPRGLLKQPDHIVGSGGISVFE